MKGDDEGQIHILEMLTLFWLFFMSATFLIRVQVPDSQSVALDASLEMAGSDAIRYGLGLEAEINGENRLEELLANDDREGVCDLLQSAVAPGKESNCWLAKDSSVSTPHGTVGTPAGGTVAVHRLVVVGSHAWTVTLDVWARGGGA
ncbi:MAG: hypothetical protein P8Q40_01825 [Candidatus Poseidonia sp.]|jgi:hypothetical protein|uniref:hypothetical protein n=1 Tax=Poseidonia sp. TaxID=2666344 RepID=UPI0030BD0210|nr:hypothetical protein [Poseidonia sp.]MDG1553013.1 hypothetical protein [Poseidonia sp.]